MALARTSLRGFLTHARYLLQVPPKSRPPLTFVVGNESADLDSIGCAIFYSYVASISPQSTKPARFHIPLLNIPREDITLRPELLALLPKANIDKSHLVTLDDLGPQSSWPSRFPPTETQVLLVDHNVLLGPLATLYSTNVTGVIDHHDDEHVVPDTASPRIITTSGSCSSLVSAHLGHAWDSWILNVSFSGASNAQSDGSLVEDGAFATLWDAQVAHLLLGAILVDTANLTDKNKTTQHDTGAIEYLETKVRLSLKHAREYNRSALYDGLIRAKRDLDRLSVRDILRKDYKQWEEAGLVLGTASVSRDIRYLVEKAKHEDQPQLTDHLRSFSADRKLDLLAVITGFEDDNGKFCREVALLATGDTAKPAMDRFVRDCTKELQLEEVDHAGKDDWTYIHWSQGNLAASRKQVAPLLRKAMSSAS